MQSQMKGREPSRCQARGVWRRRWNKGRNNSRCKRFSQTWGLWDSWGNQKQINHLDTGISEIIILSYMLNYCVMSQTSRYHVPQNFKGLMVNPILVLQSTVGPLIGRYCGIRVPPEIQSSTGILSLSFHTDMAVAKDGFSARYNITHKEVTESTFRSLNFIVLTNK